MMYINALGSRKRFARIARPICLLFCVILFGSPVFASQAAGVRSADSVLTELLKEGATRSPTFQRLLERIGEANGIVYLEFGHCAFGHLNGCLLPYVVPTTGGRYLRVVVTPDKTRVDHDGLIALLAHELQHTLEVLAHPEVVNVETMLAMYARIGRPLSGRSGYETSAAHPVQDRVASELRTDRARRPRSG
jgi:hypothetical protein